jgi:hypothetical protein
LLIAALDCPGAAAKGHILTAISQQIAMVAQLRHIVTELRAMRGLVGGVAADKKVERLKVRWPALRSRGPCHC